MAVAVTCVGLHLSPMTLRLTSPRSGAPWLPTTRRTAAMWPRTAQRSTKRGLMPLPRSFLTPRAMSSMSRVAPVTWLWRRPLSATVSPLSIWPPPCSMSWSTTPPSVVSISTRWLGDAVAPDFSPASFDVVTSRHLLWTLREPAGAMANWRELLRPGGRVVAVDGLWFTKWDENDVPTLFAEHYTASTRGELPFIHLDSPEPVVRMLTAAGFIDGEATFRPDLALGGGVPYIITATRPYEPVGKAFGG